MVTVKDSQTGKTFEVEDSHYSEVLVHSSRYSKTEPKKPAGRPKKTYTDRTEG